MIREGGNLLILALDKQVHIYSVDTAAFYDEDEQKIHRKLNRMYLFRKTLKKRKRNNNLDKKTFEKINKYLTNTNRRIKNLKDRLISELKTNSNPMYCLFDSFATFAVVPLPIKQSKTISFSFVVN